MALRKPGRTLIASILLVAASAWFTSPCLALEPDQIALVVNANVPASRELAEFYAAKRGIPAGRIIELKLPFPQEEMFFSVYDSQVVPEVRAFLNDNGLKDKVTCLVTFWGVPLRIARRSPSPPENEQLKLIQRELERVRPALATEVARAEALAKELDPAFAPGKGDDPAQAGQRSSAALSAVLRFLLSMPPGDRRADAFERFSALLKTLLGEADAAQRLASPELAAMSSRRVTAEQALRARDQAAERMRQFKQLQAAPPSPRNDDAMRAIVRDQFGLVRYLELLQGQYAQYETKETESALDSELALLWWENHYPRYRWQSNPLNHKVQSVPAGTPRTLMVMRLDGPSEQTVDRIILSSLKVEKQGLKGQVAIDARGIKTDDGYGRYDHTLRNLAELLTSKTKLKVTLDDHDALFQPGPEAPKDVALYCGWYSLRNYVPALSFDEGAVGFHVASSELVSLRTPGERGWGANLLNDGVAATLGPVAEPYLHAFPPADEFFPLLLTGDLTLAEVYWKTTPLTSWMITCIGDPLYRPYKVNPALKREDLPERLRGAIPKSAGTQ